MPKAKILVVDDEPFICRLIQSRLKANDYEVVIGSSGLEALDKAKKEKPDLIMLDIIMPQMDGLEALSGLKSNDETKSIPVIMLSAKGTQDSIIKATTELGAAAYIIKPFDPGILLDTVKKALEKKTNEQKAA